MSISHVVVLSILVSSVILIGFLGLQYYYVNSLYSSLNYELDYVKEFFESIVNAISVGGCEKFIVELSFGRILILSDGFILVNFNGQCLFSAINYILTYSCRVNLYDAEFSISEGLSNDFSFSIVGLGNSVRLCFKPLVRILNGKVIVSFVIFHGPKLNVVDCVLSLRCEVENLEYTFSPLERGYYSLKITYGSSSDVFNVYVSPDKPLTILIRILRVRWDV